MLLCEIQTTLMDLIIPLILGLCFQKNKAFYMVGKVVH